jgi:hypothetical protein
LVFGLIVTDNSNAQSTEDTVTITVSPQATLKARVGGAWVIKPLRVRLGGVWKP